MTRELATALGAALRATRGLRQIARRLTFCFATISFVWRITILRKGGKKEDEQARLRRVLDGEDVVLPLRTKTLCWDGASLG